MPLTVVRMDPILSHGRCGLVLGEVLYSDGRVARFRVSSVNRDDVRLIDHNLPKAYRDALRAWWAERRQPVA
jgi:hypothetical protein